MKEAVRIEQFSTGFDGWHYINSALYVLPHIDLETKDLKTAKLRDLHNYIMDDIDIIESITDNTKILNTIFTWDNKLPLKQYLNKTMQKQNTKYLPTFVKLGGVYKDYAMHIIIHYPFSFMRYYYLPNCKQTFYPYSGCITGGFDRAKIIYEYYKIDKEKTLEGKHKMFSNTTYHSVVKILHLIMWTSIIGIGITAFLKRKKLFFSIEDKIVFWGLFSFAVIYYASSIFAAPIEIRYLISMHSIQFVFCYVLLNKLLSSELFFFKEKNAIQTTDKQKTNSAFERKEFFRSKKASIVYLITISVVVLFICAYFIFQNFKSSNDMQTTKQMKWEETNDPRMKNYIEACSFFENLPDTVKVITRKPEIFYEFSGNKKAEGFPWRATPDEIISYLKKTEATHLILDNRFTHAYLTLYPAVQKYPEKFKVLKKIGEIDTIAKLNPTYVLEFNDGGYHGERVNGKKTDKAKN